MFDPDATIAAICTPPGNSTIGIIRISGSNTLSILQKTCTDNLHIPGKRSVIPITLKFSLCELTHDFTIKALAYIMPGPASYTRQDIAEIILPGATPLLRRILSELCVNGARLADGGEFTLRAFLSGRIGLGEAEAVERLVSAAENSDRRDALDRLNSGLSSHIMQWRDSLRMIAAELEASLDFAEEDTGDIETQQMRDKLIAITGECRKICSAARKKRSNEAGLRVTLAGLTNAGKSSLINCLSGKESAIVSGERSTTRDRLEKRLKIERFNFIFEDCPGIDFSTSTFADLASAQAREHVQRAHLLMLVIDASRKADSELENFLQLIPATPAIIVFNKTDIPGAAENTEILHKFICSNSHAEEIACCELSSTTQEGLDNLRRILIQQACADVEQSTGLLTLREETEISTAATRCEDAANALNLGAEIAALELRGAYEAFSRACGEGYGEDILQSVFSHFCIGK